MLNKFKNVKSDRWLKRYLTFIRVFDGVREKYHKHHILPKSLFPEYKDLSKYSWNLSKLGYREHLIAHYMLAKALGGNMWFAYNNMNAFNVKLKSALYDVALKEFSKQVGLYTIGMVSCKNLNGEKMRVSKEQFDSDNNLVGVTKGLFEGLNNVSKRYDVKNKISVELSGRIHILDNNIRKFIKIDELKEHHEIIPSFPDNTGFTAVKTPEGIKRITVEDFKNSDYEHFNKGRKQTEETKLLKSINSKGVKKQNTEKYKKCRILYDNNNLFIGEFVGISKLKEYCDANNISISRLIKFKNEIVPEINTTQIRNYGKVKNTDGWKLVIEN